MLTVLFGRVSSKTVCTLTCSCEVIYAWSGHDQGQEKRSRAVILHDPLDTAGASLPCVLHADGNIPDRMVRKGQHPRSGDWCPHQKSLTAKALWAKGDNLMEGCRSRPRQKNFTFMQHHPRTRSRTGPHAPMQGRNHSWF